MANRRILIIDDDVDIWKSYQLVLTPEQRDFQTSSQKIAQLLEAQKDHDESRPFFLRFAHQGQEGFGLVREALHDHLPYAVAFIDIRMPPGWDGMETARRIRQLDPDIEIVIVTAYSDRPRDEIVKAVGKADKLLFLRKPFDPEELTQIALSLSEKWDVARREEAQRLDLEAVLATSPAAIFTVNSNCHITSWNPAAEYITGYSAAEVIDKPCIIREISRNSCNECPILNGDRSDITKKCDEHAIFNREGQERVISKSISFLRDSKGHIYKAVESFWDITDKKEAEHALQISETRFRSLVETTCDWVWEMDHDGRFTYCSPVCRKIYGYKADELMGKSIFDTLLSSDDASGFGLIFKRCVQKRTGFNNIERQSLAKDGKTIYIESSATPIFDPKKKLLGFRGIDRDISRRKQNEEAKAVLEEQFRQSQKMEVLGTLAGGIAHDFNNVLTPIMLNTQISMAGLSKESALYQHLLDINKSAEKATALIRQILAFSRKQVLPPRALDLNALITDFTRMLRRLIREDIELNLDLADGIWAFNADPSQIEQILINLVVNARDAIKNEGTITIRTYNEEITSQDIFDIELQPLSGSFVVMAVSDSGVGMDKETTSLIFNPFYTTKAAGQGTGLGLSLVNGIVSQYNGHIRMESEPGHGSTFYIYFKRSDQPADADWEHNIPTVASGDETILLAEDNKEVRVVITTTLANYGYNVVEAVNGHEALQLFNNLKGKFDLLIADVVMPGMGGKALAEQLRKKDPQMPVIFMSGHPFDTASLNLTGDNHPSFIQKPFYPQHLAQKIREVLDRTKEKKARGAEVC